MFAVAQHLLYTISCSTYDHIDSYRFVVTSLRAYAPGFHVALSHNITA